MVSRTRAWPRERIKKINKKKMALCNRQFLGFWGDCGRSRRVATALKSRKLLPHNYLVHSSSVTVVRIFFFFFYSSLSPFFFSFYYCDFISLRLSTSFYNNRSASNCSFLFHSSFFPFPLTSVRCRSHLILFEYSSDTNEKEKKRVVDRYGWGAQEWANDRLTSTHLKK